MLEMINKYIIIYQDSKHRDITVEYLEAVATLRYGLSFAANLMFKCYETDGYYESLLPVEEQLFKQLFVEVENACIYTQPCEFLIKFMVRKFGMQFLKKVVNQPAFQWVIPSHLKSKKDVSLVLIKLELFSTLLFRIILLIHLYYMEKAIKIFVRLLHCHCVVRMLLSFKMLLMYVCIS